MPRAQIHVASNVTGKHDAGPLICLTPNPVGAALLFGAAGKTPADQVQQTTGAQQVRGVTRPFQAGEEGSESVPQL